MGWPRSAQDCNTLSAVVDRGDGSYTSVLYGSAAGTLVVTATVDGAPVTDSEEVVVSTDTIPSNGLLLHLDAARADGTCAPPAGARWIAPGDTSVFTEYGSGEQRIWPLSR